MVEKRVELKEGAVLVTCHICGKKVPVPPGQRLKEMVPREPEEYRHIDDKTGQPCEGMGLLCEEAINGEPVGK